MKVVGVSLAGMLHRMRFKRLGLRIIRHKGSKVPPLPPQHEAYIVSVIGIPLMFGDIFLRWVLCTKKRQGQRLQDAKW